VVTIYPNLYHIYKDSRPQVAGALLHEICHLLTAPLQALALKNIRPSEDKDVQDVVERQTERIKNAIESALPDNWWKPEWLRKQLA
jgi:hypothetical protein